MQRLKLFFQYLVAEDRNVFRLILIQYTKNLISTLMCLNKIAFIYNISFSHLSGSQKSTF